MTSANRAPKFVTLDANDVFDGPFDTEAEALAHASKDDRLYPEAAPTRVHPIGPALPAPAAKSLGEVAADAWDRHGPYEARWSYVASAVIAAHDAGRETERIVRWAVRLAPGWFGSNFCNANKSERTLFNLREHAEVIAQSFTGARIVPVPARRRRVVK